MSRKNIKYRINKILQEIEKKTYNNWNIKHQIENNKHFNGIT